MKFLKNFRYKDFLKLGVLLISYIALIVFLFFNRVSIGEWLNKLNRLLIPFVYGFVIAYLLNPMMLFFEDKVLKGKKLYLKHLRVHRLCSLLFVYTIVISILLICGIVVVPQLLNSISNIISSVPNTLNNIGVYAQEQLNNNWLVSKLYNNYPDFDGILKDLLSRLSSVVTTTYDYIIGITLFVKDFLFGLFLSIYMLMYKERAKENLLRLSHLFLSKKVSDTLFHVVNKSNEVFSGFIIAKSFDSLLVGIITYICLLLFKVPYSMLLAVLVGITNMIPVFGPIIGGIIGAILLIFADRHSFWVFVILILIIQQVDGHIIGPKIVGTKLGISVLWIIFGVTVVGGMFGIVGLFIGVPIFGVAYTLLKEYIDKKEKEIN